MDKDLLNKLTLDNWRNLQLDKKNILQAERPGTWRIFRFVLYNK